MNDTVTIGAWCGAWGDSPRVLPQLLTVPDLDYLVSDYLAEVTMALLARVRAKDPAAGGFIDEAVRVLVPHLATLHERGIKVVTNAGALNPRAAADALRAAAEAAGVPLAVAAIEGDDLTPRLDALRAAGAADMFTGEPLRAQVLTCNAYLGAFPIATALAEGADIVVTGRCVDSAVTLGPLIHEFGWRADHHDLLSAGTLIGHLIECGPQGVGGLFTDWEAVPGWENMGYPVAECRPDGTAVITKPAGTGGLVVPGSVTEQMLYEIGDPGYYLMPDVVCDWRGVRMQQVGPDRVEVSGAVGGPPPATYKATTTYPDGFRLVFTALMAGHRAAARARRAGEAMLDRAERLAGQEGIGPFTERLIEVVGSGDVIARPAAFPDAREAVVKVGARHTDRRALEIAATEMVSVALSAQGLTGVFGGRPKPAPVIGLQHLLVPKADIRITVDHGSGPREVRTAPGLPGAEVPSPALTERLVLPSATDTVTVPLIRIAYARSGDKGDHANIGVIARRPEFVALIEGQVTAEAVREWFGPWIRGPVTRWALPGSAAINILLERALGGNGGTSSLRYDPQGKSMAAILLDLPIQCPAAFEGRGWLEAR